MKNGTRRLLSLALAVIVAVSAAPLTSVHAYSDMSGQSQAVSSAVTSLTGSGVLSGYSDGTFAPNGSMTRAEFAVMLARLAGLAGDADVVKAAKSVSFPDVKPGSWYAGAAALCAAAGYINGTGDGYFHAAGTVTQQQAAGMLMRYAGLKNSQIGKWPADYDSLAESLGLTADIDYSGTARVTRGQAAYMAVKVGAVHDAINADTPQLLFVNGQAQPIFDYSTTVREVVYVETPNDTDGDGKLDLVQVLVQRPAATKKGLKVAAIYEARPYSAGTTDAYDADSYNAQIVDASLSQAQTSTSTTKADFSYRATAAQPAARVPAGECTDLSASAKDKVWSYAENLDAYDYWLVRGYAYVSCAGPGTLGSEGYETCGSAAETAAYAAVIKWLNGSARAYSDKTGLLEVKADWATGNVAMSGQSYAGTTAFAVASTGVAGLKTIVPRAGIASWYDYYRSQGTAAGGLYYPGDDCDILADYCMSRQLDSADYASVKDGYEKYLKQMIADEDRYGGDYNAFWDERNYTNGAANLKCSALIIHGLNDCNVRTKQFDMMYDAFADAGGTVKLVLHQGAHYTPSQIDGLDYYGMLGRWYAHYLYNVANGAEKMANVQVQNNRDLSWTSYDSWDGSDGSITLSGGEGAFSSDLSKTSFDTSLADVNDGWIEYASDMDYAWENEIISGSTGASKAYLFNVDKDTHISGTVTVTVKASADKPTGILSAMLVDVGSMNAVCLEKYGESVPTSVVKAGGVFMGGGLADEDTLQFSKTAVSKKIITRGWMDIQNRTSIYNTDTVTPGQTYTFTLSLQPTDYTVSAGHKLAVVLYSTDVEVTYWPSVITNYTVSSMSADIPVRQK